VAELDAGKRPLVKVTLNHSSSFVSMTTVMRGREHARVISEAKADVTRQRRVDKIMAGLREV